MMLGLKSYAQSADIHDVWCDFNVSRGNEDGMSVHTKFTVRGMLGKKVECIVFFYDSDKNDIYSSAQGYKTSAGTACSWSNLTPSYDATTFIDVENFMPARALELKEGKHRYYYRVFIRDADADILAFSDYYAFKGTGARETAETNKQKTYRNTYSDGSYADVTENPDGSATYVYHKQCFSCKGSGYCSVCQGLGGVVVGYYNKRWQGCSLCGASGKCRSCNGTGETVMVNYYNPSANSMDGYDVYTGNHYQSVYGENNAGHSGNNTSASNKPSNSSNCSYCGGTGVSKVGILGSGGVRVAYTNSSGAKCPYCDSREFHHHDRCSCTY